MSTDHSPQRVDIDPGAVIRSSANTFRIEKTLGEGGFGVVCKVQSAAGTYALKLTKMWEFMPNERVEYAKRFRQEYEYSKNLDSEYLVQSHDFDLVKGNPFMVMDYCENGSMRDLIRTRPAPGELTRIAAGILQGLAALHDQGIIHRDIKPENILLDRQQRPKLADFGISASVKKRHTQANLLGHAKSVFATCVYSPPEQMDPSRAMKVMGNTNDIYAFGVTMYEWITGGHLPFGSFEDFSEDMPGFEQRRKNDNWDRSLLEQQTPDPLWTQIIERCIQYDPGARYQHCSEILSLLGKSAGNGAHPPVTVTGNSVWSLEVKNGDEIGRIYHLTNLRRAGNRSDLTLGWLNPKDPFANHIGLKEEFTEYISQHHATLEWEPATNYWFIRDGQYRTKNGQAGWHRSTNGVLVNSRPIDESSHRLEPGDIIIIGDTSLKVRVQ